MSIIDRRSIKSQDSIADRNRFIRRSKRQVKDYIDRVYARKSMREILDATEVVLPGKTLDEPEFTYDQESGARNIVRPGNKVFDVGDQIPKSRRGNSRGAPRGARGHEDSLDNFAFVLTKEEFLDIYFSDLELPDFVKEALIDNLVTRVIRGGHTKYGPMPRLNLKKTFIKRIGRRLPALAAGKKPVYLDNSDLVFNNLLEVKEPRSQAVMFCLMDVSGSMGENEKELAKRFFLLLFLFLHKQYQNVDLVFISHTETAYEVTEHEFFYGARTGGTCVSSALILAQEIINERYPLDTYNIYLAQASDGDNFSDDNELCEANLTSLLALVQYFAYVQIESLNNRFARDVSGSLDLFAIYRQVSSTNPKLQARSLSHPSAVFEVLYDLFKKR